MLSSFFWNHAQNVITNSKMIQMVTQITSRNSYDFVSLHLKFRASLVAQWLRIHLPMQGTRVRALVWEDPTCRGATVPVSHNY